MVVKRRVVAIGSKIGKVTPLKSHENRGGRNRPKPRISDIPKEVRQKVTDILVAHERWGSQKHSIAADALIRLSNQSKVPVSTLTYMLRRHNTDLDLMRALITRLEAMEKKQGKRPFV